MNIGVYSGKIYDDKVSTKDVHECHVPISKELAEHPAALEAYRQLLRRNHHCDECRGCAVKKGRIDFI